jgi:hypothetical protein
MNTTYELHRDLPKLDRPVLVVSLNGWIDASGAAAAAAMAVESACTTELLATFDGDTFIDYRARRPTMELRDGVNSRLDWGDIQMKLGADHKGTPVLTLTGPEPDSQWRRFAAGVTELAMQLDVYQMIAFGAYPFATPHSRASRISITSPSLDHCRTSRAPSTFRPECRQCSNTRSPKPELRHSACGSRCPITSVR